MQRDILRLVAIYLLLNFSSVLTSLKVISPFSAILMHPELAVHVRHVGMCNRLLRYLSQLSYLL